MSHIPRNNAPEALPEALPEDAGREMVAMAASIKGAAVSALAGPRDPGPDETRQLFQIIDRQADRLSVLARALIRPGQPGPHEPDGLRIDHERRLVTLSGRPVRLTATEYDILHELSANAGHVLTHDRLLLRVRGPEYLGNPRLLQAHIKTLRRKLGDDARNPRHILTEFRVGYRMPAPRPPSGIPETPKRGSIPDG